ncbi:MAG: SpoVR family protein [Candidatus Melainabacteria bacterium]|nr:SpoVR family protein [Candidatus Melainabacteria bacterium]
MLQRTLPVGQTVPGYVAKVAGSTAGDKKDLTVCSQSTTDVTQVKNVELPYEYKAAAAIGRGITGQRSYPVSPETNPEYWSWNKKIYEVAKREGLDLYDVVYWVCRRDALLQAAARGGFPVNLSHWKNGMEFYELHEGHKFNLSRIYEMIINNNPSHAYLLEGNDLVDQKLVMSHCMGHSDFFKNNIHFRHTDRNMLNRIAEHAAYQGHVLDTESVSFVEMEKFLERAYSIDDLIDYSDLEPRQLQFELQQEKHADKIPDDYGIIDVPELPSHMQGRINDPERIKKEREVERGRLEREAQKIPKHPDYDVIGFIIEHSKALKPWQRQVLMHIREQAYYYAPQGLTKIMNEGWAVYWHRKLMSHPEIVDLRHASAFADHNAGTIAISRGQINPYRVGYEIFMDIEERWNTGRHGEKWGEIEDEREKRDFDDKSMKGFGKIFDVRKWEKDATFVDKYLTPEVAEKLKLFTWEQKGEDYVIASRRFEEVKAKLVQQLHRGGRPAIAVRDGNYDNKGELLLHHDFSYDLKQDYAIETLKNLLSLWGNAVHLNTKLYLDDDKPTPVRITAENIILMDSDKEKPGIRITFRKAYEKTNEDGLVEFHPATDVLNEIKEEVQP